MSSDTREVELFDRHIQALGEARRCCEHLGSQLDPEKAAPRGWAYAELKKSLKYAEDSLRQVAAYRSDTRWLKLAMIYARAMRAAQIKFVGQKWGWFTGLVKVLDAGLVNMDTLKHTRTGARGPILPTRPASEWLIMPDWRLPRPPGMQ
jgi:hypothetical protein